MTIMEKVLLVIVALQLLLGFIGLLIHFDLRSDFKTQGWTKDDYARVNGELKAERNTLGQRLNDQELVIRRIVAKYGEKEENHRVATIECNMVPHNATYVTYRKFVVGKESKC